MFINGDLPDLEYPGRPSTSQLVKQKLTAPPGSSWKMFGMLYLMVLKKMLLNLYLNFDGVLRNWCLESTMTN